MPVMPKNLSFAVGLLGMAALGVWIATRRPRRAGLLESDPEMAPGLDDHAAELIAFYRPAIERALAQV